MFRSLCWLALASSLLAQDVPVKTVITVEPHKGEQAAQLTKDDVLVYRDKQRLPVTSWVPVRNNPSGVQLWVLIDDGLESGFGVQIADLRKFITQLPPYIQVGVGYMRNGTVTPTEKLTNDHEAAAKSVRLPLGTPGISASPYMSVTDLFDKWPSGDQAREVLMITSGIDPYYGSGPDNPYLAHAIDQAQRGGAVVHSIYYGGAGHFGHSYWQITWGQNYLSQLADATGGEFFWQGNLSPVSLAPFLDQLTQRLQSQFLLTFGAPAGSKAEFERVRFSTEAPHVTLVGPTRVWVPAGK